MKSPDLQRILALPIRPAHSTSRNYKPENGLLPVQAWALDELARIKGLLAPIGVGGGKTLISFLAPFVIKAQRPLLLIPAKLRAKTLLDRERYQSMGWYLPPLEICSYELISRRPEHLEVLQPDLIIADECHRLKNRRAGVTRRVARYFAKHPKTKFIGLSGTITSRSLADFAHLLGWALDEQSPLPLRPLDLLHWCAAVDETKQNPWETYRPGALRVFGKTREQVRRGVYERIYSTLGVVHTPGIVDIPTSLYWSSWGHLPASCTRILKEVEGTWERPDGELLTRSTDVWRLVREISQGFFYRWEPPPPRWWLEPRRRWKAFVRATLADSRTLDTEMAVAKAYSNRPELLAWRAVRDKYQYELVAEWITDEVVTAAAEWAHSTGGLIWVEHRAVGEALVRHGIRYFGEGSAARLERHDGPAAASIAACGEGANLQKWHENLVLSPPSSGKVWEQLLGRTHRTGQQADEVIYNIMLTTDSAIDSLIQACKDAEYQQILTGQQQRLLFMEELSG